MQPIMTTYTGKIINPVNLQPEDICIEDIAHALALCNRFAGHSREPMSVAQHSVTVCKIIQHRYPTWRRGALQGLLHDAAEAYIGDVTKWLKRTPAFATYRRIEDMLEKQIYERFGCPIKKTTRVACADKLALRLEGELAFEPETWHRLCNHIGYKPLTEKERNFYFFGARSIWSWQTAERMFLTEFYNLSDLSCT